MMEWLLDWALIVAVGLLTALLTAAVYIEVREFVRRQSIIHHRGRNR
jgi:hypothetical protein